MPADTIPARFMEQAKIRPDSPAYYVRAGGTWRPTSWRNYVREVKTAARSLCSLGVKPGQTICILGFNRPEWVIMDIANMVVGGAPAGIYTTCSAEEVQYIIAHAEAPLVVLEDVGQWEKVKEQRDNLPELKHVVMMQGAPKIDDPLVMSWDEFLAKAGDVDDAKIDLLVEKLDETKTATLIYTSGTTGPPKGVMLTHKNLAWTSQIAQGLVALRSQDCTLSYLPLSHIAEQMFSIHGPITAGSAVYFAESIEKVPDNMKEVQPTVFFGVPRIWEKLYAGVNNKLKGAEGAKAHLVAWARGVANQVTDLRNAGKNPSGLLVLQYALADKLIFSKLKPALGLGRARVCVSGAAPIAKEVLEFFAGLDLVVHEVYGQSEGSGPTSFNLPGRTKYGTVGPALPGAEVKIADDGEICVRGPNVFSGYYKDPVTSGETLIDGWLHSGDLGSFDSDGYLSITGRKKDIIITAGGKNITPKNIESALKNIDVVGEAVLIGDRRKYISALISLDPDAMSIFSKENDISEEDAHANSLLLSHIQRGVDGVNDKFARVEHVRKFSVLKRALSVEDGELTPTLKVKRKIVHEHFEAEIEAMYAD
ncbi:MAG: long-chain fatty acid--CoA ligase [Myxococcota bacterium]|nr:long-chain fatty acid--CoA ligase [Myxococcota bacterium]